MTADRIALAYFVYLALAAWLVPRTPARQRAGVCLIALVTAVLAYVAAELRPLAATGADSPTSERSPAWHAGHAWLPIVWLVLGYWLPAGLWRGPMPRVEALLLASDRWLLRLDPPAADVEAAGDVEADVETGAAGPFRPSAASRGGLADPFGARLGDGFADRPFARFPRRHTDDAQLSHPLFEAAYLLVHPIVPAAWLMLWLTGHQALVDRFWSAVLIAGYACYGTLPWIQTRPPRLLPCSRSSASSASSAWSTSSARPASSAWSASSASSPSAAASMSSPSSPSPSSASSASSSLYRGEPASPRTFNLRRLNLRILDLVSIKANTFPSGHAAVAMLVALCVTTVLPAIGALFLILAALIAAATVLGRYHYTADTLAGLVIAFLAWTVIFLRP